MPNLRFPMSVILTIAVFFFTGSAYAVSCPAATGRYADYLSGGHIEAGPLSLDKSSGYEAVFVTKSIRLSDDSCRNKIFFVKKGVVSVVAGTRLHNTVIVGNIPGIKPVVRISGASCSGTVVFEDVALDCRNIPDEPLLEFSEEGQMRFVLDACKVKCSGAGLLHSSASGGIAFSDISIRNNVFYSDKKGVSCLWTGVSGKDTGVASLDISGNVFLNVRASAFAETAAVGNYTAKGNLYYDDVAVGTVTTFHGPHSMYSDRGKYSFLMRLLSSGKVPSGTMECKGNMCYTLHGGNMLLDYTYTDSGTVVVPVPGHQIQNPFSSVDVAAGTFTYSRILGESTATMDGRVVRNPVDCSSRTVYIRHDPSGENVSDIAFNCLGTGASAGELTGSWPAKTVTLSRGPETETWTVRLLDVPQNSDIQQIASYAPDFWKLEWADEFLLDDYDRETWARRERSSTTSVYDCYYVTPDTYSGFDDLVNVEDGDLVIRARKTGDPSLGANGYVSAGVMTFNVLDRGAARRNFKLCDASDAGYWGRIDVRISYRLGDDDQGIRAAAWMLPGVYPQPANPTGGELDILEHPSHVKNKSTRGWVRNYKTFQTIHNQYLYNDIGKKGGMQWGRVNDDESQYHVYTVLIASNDCIRFFIDGVQTGEYAKKDFQDSGYDAWHWWPFDRYDYYLLLTHQFIGDQATADRKGWDGPARGPFEDTRMNIDYVRFFTKR